MSDWKDVGAAADFNEDEPCAVSPDGEAIAIFRLGEVHA
jgi:hypothetical protein